MRRSYKTTKGTELPLLNLRGREYLEVKHRVVWFREDHADWRIETEVIAFKPDADAYVRAMIKDANGNIMAMAHKYENKKGFPDFLEKAETGSIGRALALVGYGTQFCADELDEGQRVVDAPVEPRAELSAQTPQEEPEAGIPKDAGDYRVTFGKKYKGLKIKDIPRAELEGFLEWLEENAAKKAMPLSEEARIFRVAIKRYFTQKEGA